MTAFNSIKTNNWPAASNDLEDFLVLKLPLNDQASLTESLPVNAGSTVLHPKRTLTNTGVSSSEAGGAKKHYDNNAVFGGTHQLTIPASPAFNLAGDFTYEAWTYQDAAVTNGTYISSAGYYSGSNGGNWVLRRSSATQIGFATYDGTSNAEYTELSATTSLNTWHHIALTRSGTTVQLFVDGVAGGSMTVSKGLEDGANNGLVIGNASSNVPWNGKFQDVRLYNGVAKYTANFTPPGAILG